MRRGVTDLEYFEDRISKQPDSCWLWTGSHESDGYGYFVRGSASRGRRQGFAHRFAYELFVGPIPPGLTIDHLCRVRNCVNPSHLEAVTHAVNMGRIPSKKACRQGHAYTPENTYYYPDGHSYRCRTCHNINNRRWLRENRK